MDENQADRTAYQNYLDHLRIAQAFSEKAKAYYSSVDRYHNGQAADRAAGKLAEANGRRCKKLAEDWWQRALEIDATK